MAAGERNAARDTLILSMREKGTVYRVIGERFGIGPERVRQIVNLERAKRDGVYGRG